MSGFEGFNDKVGFVWSVADLLRGDIRQHECGQFILPSSSCAVWTASSTPPRTRSSSVPSRWRARSATSNPSSNGSPAHPSTTPAR